MRSRPEVAHFRRSLRCGDRTRLQSYFCLGSMAGSMRVLDPKAVLGRRNCCKAALASALCARPDILLASIWMGDRNAEAGVRCANWRGVGVAPHGACPGRNMASRARSRAIGTPVAYSRY
jgi:hypothetical protein